MKEDIQNYSPTVMFRGTPCIFFTEKDYLWLLHQCSITAINKTNLVNPTM